MQSYLPNRNTSVFDSTITVSSLYSNKTTFSTLQGSSITATNTNATTFQGSTITTLLSNVSSLTTNGMYFSTLQGSSITATNTNATLITASSLNAGSTLNAASTFFSSMTGSTIFSVGHLTSTMTVSSLSAYNGSSINVSASTIGLSAVNGVGIGTINPAYSLHVVGNIYASGDITALSDERYKYNITTLTDSLYKMKRLSGYTYTMKEDTMKMGLLAQEVQQIFPEAVHYDQINDMYSLNYNSMVAPLVESIKELSAENQALKQKTAALETQQNLMKHQLNSIISMLDK